MTASRFARLLRGDAESMHIVNRTRSKLAKLCMLCLFLFSTCNDSTPARKMVGYAIIFHFDLKHWRVFVYNKYVQEEAP